MFHFIGLDCDPKLKKPKKNKQFYANSTMEIEKYHYTYTTNFHHPLNHL